MSEGVCFAAGCGALDCGHLRWLDDGLGQWAQQCGPGCDLQVVRPGHFQCSCGEAPDSSLAMGTETATIEVDNKPNQEGQ